MKKQEKQIVEVRHITPFGIIVGFGLIFYGLSELQAMYPATIGWVLAGTIIWSIVTILK